MCLLSAWDRWKQRRWRRHKASRGNYHGSTERTNGRKANAFQGEPTTATPKSTQAALTPQGRGLT